MRLNKTLFFIFFAAILFGNSTNSFAHDNHRKTGIVKFDVVENASRFFFASQPVFEEDGMPDYGNSFITQGYIYPYGFLDENSGVLADGSPSHPEEVLGTWTCRGVFIGDGAHTTTGPWIVSTQTYELFENAGHEIGKYSTDRMLISEGYEIADIDVTFSRVLTGGTGRFVKAQGIVEQKLLGFTEQMGAKNRFIIKLINK